MPKVTLRNFQRRIEKQNQRFDYVRGIIAGERERLNLTEAELAAILNMETRTFNAKVNNPERIGLDDLYDIMDALNVKIKFERPEIL